MGRRAALLATLALLVGGVVWWRWPSAAPTSDAERGTARAEPTPGAAPVALQGAAPPRSADPKAIAPRTPIAADDPLRREFVGQVVDEQGKPVAGATVRLATGRPESDVEGLAGEDGRFLLVTRVPERPPQGNGYVFARHGTRVGEALAWLRTDGSGGTEGRRTFNVGSIVLAEAVALDVEVRSRCPKGLPARVLVLRANLGSAMPLAESLTDAAGKVHFEGLRPGPARVMAAAEGCGRVEARTTLTRGDASPLVLEIPESRSITVLVVEKESGAPIAGAQIDLLLDVQAAQGRSREPPAPLPSSLTTGADGRASLAGFGPDDVVLATASAAGYPPPALGARREGPYTARLGAGETEARIELMKPRTVAWPMKAGSAPVPPDGTVITLSPWTNSGLKVVPATGRMEGGRLVVSGWGPGYASAYAHAPGGGIARLQAQPDQEVGPETEFHVARTIEVVVTLEGEGPAMGWFATPYDQGNNAVVPGVATDATGTARITDLFGGTGNLVDVRVSSTASAWGGFPAGSVDLGQRDGHLEVTIPRERDVVLAVRIDGRPGLPPPPVSVMMGSGIIKDVERDERAAELRFRWRPSPGATSGDANLTLAGFLPTYAHLEIAPGTEPLRGTLGLVTAGSLWVRVDPPKDGRHAVVAQRFDETKNEWPGEPWGNAQNAVGSSERAKAGPDGIARITPLKPGRYRVFDPYSGIVSAEVAVGPGEPPAEVRLDLKGAGWVKGRVEVPEGESPLGALVGPAEATRPTPTGGIAFFGPTGAASVDKDGNFWFRVSGDRRIRIRASHHMLRADPKDGYADVQEPREGLVLRLIRGPTALVRFEKPVMEFMNRGSKRPLGVRLYEGEPVGQPKATLTAMLEGDGRSATFGGFEPGTWTLWIDTPPFAPLVLRGVTLADGANDLGTQTPPEGARFVLEVKVKEGQDAPRYSIWIVAEADGGYVRSGELFTGGQGVVTGLARGRYKVTASPYAGGKGLPQEVIEFDGTTEVRRTIDLR